MQKKESFDNIQYPFMVKNFQQTRNKRELLNLTKGTWNV